MSLSMRDTTTLLRDGFTRSEIRAFSNAVAPDGTPQAIDIYNDVWRVARTSRRAWVKEQRQVLKDFGYPNWEINTILVGEIEWYYESGRVATPFDFIREVYSRSLFGNIAVSDYQNRRASQARKRTKRLYDFKKAKYIRGS